MRKTTATAVGFTAVLLWALLALFTAASGDVPPFQLAAMTFALATLVGLASWITKPEMWHALRQPWPVWLLGISGLFGYHFFYFTALRNAPPVEAGLIAYLWPLLIVLMSALLPGERIGWHHILGGILGLAGAAFIVTGGTGFNFKAEYGFGYAMALVCAFTWSGYSVLSRRFAAVPTGIITGYCAATASLSLICHLALEQTVWPQQGIEWLAILGLGLGPAGLAFYVWDYGVKNGDIQVLGAASYAAPLLSTLILIATGFAPFTWAIALACVLITAGAALAAKDLFS
jgi:drug/metabolite transporter (DMT)-like permease